MNVFSQNGWLSIWNAAVGSAVLVRIRLFQNNYVPTPYDTTSAYTEATFSGYPGFTNLAFGAAFINGANQGEIDSPQVTWTQDGGPTGNLIYGVYVTDATDKLIYADRFPAPVNMVSVGNQIQYTPSCTLIDQ